MNVGFFYFGRGWEKKKKKKLITNQSKGNRYYGKEGEEVTLILASYSFSFFFSFSFKKRNFYCSKMESNKDEALKCLTIAKKSLELGDYSKALRFTEKSIRLFPTSQGEQLLSIVQKKNAEPRKPTASAPTTTKTSAKRQTTPEPVQERKYTVEQLRAVKTMLAYGKDYYKILSVDKSATDAEIKKAYRKVSL